MILSDLCGFLIISEFNCDNLKIEDSFPETAFVGKFTVSETPPKKDSELCKSIVRIANFVAS